MDKETIELNIGKDTKITCRKPTEVEIYIHSMMNLLYDGKSRSFIKNSIPDYYFRRNGFNNDV
jgi:hypothetical protein